MGSALEAAREFFADEYRVSSPNPIALLAALVAEIDAAPVVMVGESINYGAMVAGTGIQNGQRVALLRVGGAGE